MNIFVTGGTGFLGSRLIQRLVKENHKVKALSRNPSSMDKLKKLGAEAISGDFENLNSWTNSLIGVDIVIHAAAPVEFWGDWKKFYNEIVLNTKNLFEASALYNVKRFIYISSESVLQDEKPLFEIDESFPYPKEPNSFYGKSKKLAELEILNSNLEIESIILRPTFIWGKGVKALESMVEKVNSGQFMWIDNGETIIEMVHVDNVVEAIVLSLTNGKTKQIYNITDYRPMKVKEFLTKLFQTKNIIPPNKNMNGKIASIAASLVEGIWKFLGIKTNPPLSRFELSFVSMPRKYIPNKAIKELNYKPIVSLEEGLNEMKN